MSLVVLQQSDAVLEVGAMIRTLWTKAADDGSLLKRLVRGQKMARTKGQVKRLSCKRFRVKSQSKKTDYEVRIGDDGLSCTCPDHQNRKRICIHIAAVLQRCSDLARDKLDARAEAGAAKDSGASERRTDYTGADGCGADGGKTVDDITKEEAVDLLTNKFPRVDVKKMLDMPPKAALLSMAEAFGNPAPQEASTDVQAHIQALLLCMVKDIAAADPEFVVKLEEAGNSPPCCPECGADYTKNGVRHNKKGPEQTYRCKGPKHHRFVFNPGFEGRRYDKVLITRAVRLYCRMGSIREVAKELTSEGDDGPHYSTIARWIHDMVSMTVEYLRGLGMKGIGRVCSTDEIIENVWGEGQCVSTVLDHGTRFCLAVNVSATKDGQNSAELFRAAKETAGRNPWVTLSDSLEAIAAGHNEVFGDDTFSILIPEAHIRNQRCTNNRHERYNSTLRHMVGGRRSRLSRMVIDAVWLFYNYIRTHIDLGDITPAEEAGMSIAGPNMLLTLNAMSKMAVPHPQWTRNLEKACQAT